MTRVTCTNPACGRSIEREPTVPLSPVLCPSCGEPLPKPQGDSRRLSLRNLIEGSHLTISKVSTAMVAFECSHSDCRAKIQARADHAGKSAVCPKCGRAVVVVGPRDEPMVVADPLRVACPKCRKPILAWPKQAGRTVRMPSLAHRLVIPANLGAAETSKETPAERPAVPVAPPSGPVLGSFEVDEKTDHNRGEASTADVPGQKSLFEVISVSTKTSDSVWKREDS